MKKYHINYYILASNPKLQISTTIHQTEGLPGMSHPNAPLKLHRPIRLPPLVDTLEETPPRVGKNHQRYNNTSRPLRNPLTITTVSTTTSQIPSSITKNNRIELAQLNQNTSKPKSQHTTTFLARFIPTTFHFTPNTKPTIDDSTTKLNEIQSSHPWP